MSDPATETTLDKVADAFDKALPIAAAIATALAPEAAAIIALSVKIGEGVAAGIPEAEALWAQFESGTPPTQEQLDAYAATEQTAYETLMADIKAKLAAPPST